MDKKSFKLDNPIKVNNDLITELFYDPMEITAAQFNEACARSAALDKTKSMTFKTRQNDYGLHLYLGMMAVIAVMPQIDVSDLERLKGYDVLELTDIGMLFIYRRWGDNSGTSSSEKPSELTPSDTTPASETSEE